MSLTLEQIDELLDRKLNQKFDQKLKNVISKDEAEKLFDKKLEPIYNKLNDISRDISQIRRDLGYDNLRVIKTDKEKM